MCVHSDDVDMVCECPQDGIAISDAFNTKFRSLVVMTTAVSADRSTTSSRSVAHGVRRLDWSGCMNGPEHPEQFIALSHSNIDIEY